jgi:signal transduction histidine kinase
VAPLLFVWSRRDRVALPPHWIAEALVPLVASGALSLVVFGNVVASTLSAFPYLVFPVVIWAAVRLGPHGAVTATALVAVSAIWGTVQGGGPFVGPTLHEGLFALQGFMSIVAVTSLILAAVVAERRQAEAALQAKRDELRAMTQHLWHAAKLATMGELTASIAHELNNPLATVTLRVESLLAQTAEDDPQRRALTVIEQEVERMATLVANLLQWSRRGQPQMSALDVRDELDTTLALIQYALRDHRITVVRQFAPDVPLLHADRHQLHQVFLNLLTNASDAMPQGGTLTVGVATGRLEPEDPAVVITVTDTGIGIAPEDMAKVLEPFFTTKEEGKGTGLGLAICRRVVQEHHGTIALTSSLGMGTTVRLVLPVTPPTASAAVPETGWLLR